MNEATKWFQWASPAEIITLISLSVYTQQMLYCRYQPFIR